MSHFDKFVVDGIEKADDGKGRSNAGRRIHGADKSKKVTARVSERRGVRSLAVCGQRSLFGGGMERL